MQILEDQQNAIASITETVATQNNHDNASSSSSMAWDWNAVEDTIDDKIASVVKAQLETKFDGLAQQIAEQIAKEMEPSTDPYNEHIIRPSAPSNGHFEHENAESA